MALERFAQAAPDEVPELRLQKMNERRVLIDCGFDLSDEMNGLRQLCELGIITKEELDTRLREYMPDDASV